VNRRRVKSWGGVTIAQLQERWNRETVFVYGEIDSTNTIAREMVSKGADPGTVVMSRAQTAGRGRGSHTFHSPSNQGVYLTMIFHPPGEWLGRPVTILAGLGVALELERAFPDLRPGLKWPNDLMARDRKLGGILAETVPGSDGTDRLVIGVGINLTTEALPAELSGRVIGVRDCCEVVEPSDVADAIVRGLERWSHDPPEVLSEEALTELDRLDRLKNRRVALGDPDETPVVGRAAGLAPDGALLFRPDRGALRRVTGGSVEILEEPSNNPAAC
jgi:BirA family biotin operon repressor/biotin-[acetyl-CoA-carboxylase] ligase